MALFCSRVMPTVVCGTNRLAIATLALVFCLRAHGDTADHWSFQPVTQSVGGKQSAPPNSIDHYVQQRLDALGLRPAGRADPATLLRRVTFVLTGLPPTPEQYREFLADSSPQAYQQLVDSLLASPDFGERWGRHWLDVARFAESSGGGRSIMFPDAWRYRDYVLDAFNQDLPFDRFIEEQIAGDLLPYDTPAERDRQLTATGFLVLGAINYELQDKALLDMEVVDEQIEAVGRAFLGMSLGCARCHDHKFDPVTQEEYYAIAGIFTSTHSVVHSNVGKPNQVPCSRSQESPSTWRLPSTFRN